MSAMAKIEETTGAAAPAPEATHELRQAEGPGAVLRFFESYTDDEGQPGTRERVLKAEELEEGYWFFRPKTEADVLALDASGAPVARKAMGVEKARTKTKAKTKAKTQTQTEDATAPEDEDQAGDHTPPPTPDKE